MAKERQRIQSLLLEAKGLPCRRAEEGWEVQAATLGQGLNERVAPETMMPVERYLWELENLQELTSTEEPSKQLYQATHQSTFFVIGDASGKAKGSTVVEQYGVDYESGTWNLKWRLKLLNCREVENLMDRLEHLVGEGSLQNHEVFLITDNLAFKGAYYKGHSPSRELSDIVFQVHKAQRDGGFVLHVIHISEKRMKVSGVDGLSRGDLTEGMMA
jgi:hypothetical protein